MKITKVTVYNLNSLRIRVTIDFTSPPLVGTGLFAITGDTGAGKTTLLDAITLALYGRVHRNKDVKEVMSYGAVESLSEVEFTAGEHLYRAKWSIWRAHKKETGEIKGPQRELSKWNPTTQVFEILAEKTREVDDKVEAVTGLDYDRFCRSVLLSQGDFAAFLKSGEKERSDLLERITGAEIYSRLSIAAFERHKLEFQKLTDLRRSLESLSILSEEDALALEKELEAKTRESVQFQQSRETVRTYLEWRRQVERLTMRRADLIKEKESWEAALEAAQPSFQRLHQAKKTLKHQSGLQRLESGILRHSQLHTDLEALSHQKKALELQLQIQRDQDLLAASQLKSLETAYAKELPVWEKTITLDITIGERNSTLLTQQANLLEAQERMQQLEAEQVNAGQAIQSMTTRRQELDQWLRDHDSSRVLAQELSLIEQMRTELREIWKSFKDAENRLADFDAKEKRIAGDWEEVSIQAATAEAVCRSLQTSFDNTAPDYFVTNRTELLQKIYDEIEKLTAQKSRLSQLNEYNERYQRLLLDLADWEDKLSELRHQESGLNKDLMNTLEELEELEQVRHFKRQVYEQQLIIGSYEKDRANLQPNEPCPLCFSTHHPFREHDFTPFVDKARHELDSAEAKYRAVLKRQNELLLRHSEIARQIGELSGDTKTPGQLDQTRRELLEQEEVLVQFMAAGFENITVQAVGRSLADFEHNLESQRRLRERLSQIDKELAVKEKEYQELAQRRQTLGTELELIRQRLTDARENAGLEKGRWEKAVTKLNALVNPFGVQLAKVDDAANLFSDLKARVEQYDEQRKALDALLSELDLARQKFQQAESAHTELTKQVGQLQKQYNENRQLLEEIRRQRSALLGEKDPRFEQSAHLALLESKREALQTQREQLSESEKNERSISRLMAEKEAEYEGLTTEISALEAELLIAVKEDGFDDLHALRNAMMDGTERDFLEKQQQELAQRGAVLNSALEETGAALETESAKNLTEKNPETLQSELNELEQQYREVMQSLGSLREKLAERERRLQEAGSLQHRIKKQEQELGRWARLNEIIGQADGKKFRVFAQGLTLRRLTALANQHLQLLNGRYIIEKKSEEDLDLEIIDTFQANHRRSMNTLSGGESFLVSLALALGLSDLAGRDAQIHSLFIDEGFGTLDDNSLDLALSTLENLQAGGKTIGVISHVNALKERIGTQIRVHRRGNGFSEVEII